MPDCTNPLLQGFEDFGGKLECISALLKELNTHPTVTFEVSKEGRAVLTTESCGMYYVDFDKHSIREVQRLLDALLTVTEWE